MITNAEGRIRKQTERLSKTVSSSASKLITTALDLGQCIKTCYLKKNDPQKKGFCFDRKG